MKHASMEKHRGEAAKERKVFARNRILLHNLSPYRQAVLGRASVNDQIDGDQPDRGEGKALRRVLAFIGEEHLGGLVGFGCESLSCRNLSQYVAELLVLGKVRHLWAFGLG